MSIQTINENFLRTIIREFCKQKYPFQSSLKIVGSIHVVIDNNEVLSCLLNENLSSPMATSSDQLATRKSASATDNSNSEEEQKQCSDSNSVSSSSSSTTVNKLNKRKRFVPRAHPNEQTPAIEEKRKEEVEENNDDDENSENMVIDEGSFCDGENDAEQAKMKEENVCDDLEHEIKDQAIKKSVLGSISSNKTTTTPISKKRNGLNLQFSDVTNVVQTPPMQIGMGERATMSDGDEDEGAIKTNSLGGILSKLVMHSAGKALTGAAANGDQSEFECTACDKKFKYFCYYKRHMDARHSDEPKFVCEFCYKTYKWEASYRHHLRQHQQNNVKIEIENKEN